MLTLTSPVKTWAHRLPAGGKLAVLSLWTVLVLHLSGVWLGLAVLGVTVLVATGGRDFAAEWLRMLRPLWPFVVIASLWHLALGMPIGAVTVILRLVAAVGLANAVTMTTPLDEIMALLTRLLRPLSWVGLQPKVIALAVALVIRFVPVMLQRYGQISDAWRMRSPRRPGGRVLMPVLLAALDDADRVAEALRARGGAS